jgi:hypothetical protein
LNKKIILAHSGKQHSYHVAKALFDLGYLEKFYTSSYIRSGFLQGVINKANLNFWSRRFIDGLYGNAVDCNWKYEAKEIVHRRLKGNSNYINELVYKRDIGFDQALANKLKKLDYTVYWGFQGSSHECLKVVAGENRTGICEMTSVSLPFAKKILMEEAILHPEWADSIGFAELPAHYEKRILEEPQIAKHVIAISSFLKQTLLADGINADKIHVLPLGFDAKKIKYIPQTDTINNRSLRILFAGRITQGKGMKYLLDAMKMFNKQDVELHIIGNIFGSGNAFKKYSPYYNYRPGVSQAELFQLYSNYDVLVFPSLLEGFGLVTVEAMGAGLPVITTPNTNATEVIKDGENGFLVPIRDTEAIVNAIGKIRNMDDGQFQQMRRNARNTALQYTWDVYRENLAQLLINNIN